MCQDDKPAWVAFGVAEKDTESTDSTRSLDFSSNRNVVLFPVVSAACGFPVLRARPHLRN
jgi:hypothetical protein